MSQLQTEPTSADTSVVEQAQEKIQEGASQAKTAARDALTQQIDERSTQVGQQLRGVAEAFRRTGRGLHSEGNAMPARVVEGLSDRAERLGSYLEGSSSNRLLHDAEHYGRRNPWVVIVGGMAVGIAASRLLKASSSRRFDQLREQGYSSHLAHTQWKGTTPGGAGS